MNPLAAESNRLGMAAHRAGDVADAEAAYTIALARDPHFAEAYANRAAARGQRGDTAGAFADYSVALRLRPDFPDALNNRGTLRRELSDVTAALADFDRALELDPDHADARANRAVAYHLTRNYAGVAEDLTRALAAPPGRSGVDARRHLLTVFRGDAFYHLGRTADSMADYRAAFADRPAAFARLVCRTLATIVHDFGADAILADCDRHLADNPNDFLSLGRRAVILLGLGRREEAEAERAACYAAGDPADAPLFESLLDFARRNPL